MKQSKWTFIRGTSFKKEISWDEIGVTADQVSMVSMAAIMKDGITSVARFNVEVTYDCLIVRLSASEGSRLKGLHRFNINLALVEPVGEVVAAAYGYLEAR
ncbi:hypothetical protein ACJ7VZ_05275 [Aeromonas salmonicida]|uniref:hypothetical protein n=1 Tax=Aeromonas salmonicida TaxID=645 RepID=UPI0038B97333